jgi:nifR3 family TIM-barrel protein
VYSKFLLELAKKTAIRGILKKSFQLGSLNISPNVFLSPMHGVSDQAFRLLLQELSKGRCGLLVSEFVAMESLIAGGGIEQRQMKFCDAERPFGIQIFGADPASMQKGAEKVLELNPDFIELNCGCPAPKVVKRGGGSSLLKDLPRLRDIVQRLRSVTQGPLSVKVRIGWDDDQINVRDVLNLCEEEGVDLFVIHGRTRMQGYTGKANWELIDEIAKEAKIPVIGNGDALTVEDVVNRLETSAVDGVSIGRGALHNPWIFNQIADFWEKGSYTTTTPEEQFELFKRYEELLVESGFTTLRTLGRLKQMGARLTKCFPVLKESRPLLLRTKTVEDFLEMLKSILDNVEESPFVVELEDLNGKSK